MRLQHGFGIITAIVILLLLAVLAGGLVALNTTQSTVLSQDILSARAEQSARAGTEWGLHRAFSGSNAWAGGQRCSDAAVTQTTPATATVDMSAINGFQVTVTCWSSLYNEGETAPGTTKTVRVYQITAVACPAGTTSCPRTDASSSSANYVERRREAVGI